MIALLVLVKSVIELMADKWNGGDGETKLDHSSTDTSSITTQGKTVIMSTSVYHYYYSLQSLSYYLVCCEGEQ